MDPGVEPLVGLSDGGGDDDKQVRHFRASYHASRCASGASGRSASDDDCALEVADNKFELVLVWYLEQSRPIHTLDGCPSCECLAGDGCCACGDYGECGGP